MRQSVMVTGGAGYIGSYICKQLAQEGSLPITVDNLSRGHRKSVKWGPLEVGDVGDQEFVRAVLDKYNTKHVIHCAAYAYVQESMEKPELYFENNVTKQITFLDTLAGWGVEKLVFSSSCAVYGNPLKIPITEEHPLMPISPYGETKLLMEKAIQSSRIPFVILRYFNAAGGVEKHDPETHLIPNVLSGEFTLYGDGSAVRDYVHVEDLARAHLLSLEKEDLILNLGTGKGISVAEVVEAAEKLLGKKIKSKSEKAREGDPDILIADASKAEALLGWTPKHSNLQSILESAIPQEAAEAPTHQE